jgi:hypothetical protein
MQQTSKVGRMGNSNTTVCVVEGTLVGEETKEEVGDDGTHSMGVRSIKDIFLISLLLYYLLILTWFCPPISTPYSASYSAPRPIAFHSSCP